MVSPNVDGAVARACSTIQFKRHRYLFHSAQSLYSFLYRIKSLWIQKMVYPLFICLSLFFFSFLRKTKNKNILAMDESSPFSWWRHWSEKGKKLSMSHFSTLSLDPPPNKQKKTQRVEWKSASRLCVQRLCAFIYTEREREKEKKREYRIK